MISELERAGFVCTEQHKYYFSAVPRTLGYLMRGVAVRPA